MSGGGLSSLSFLDRDDGRQLDGATQAGDPAAAKPKRAESLRERAGRTLRDAKRQWKAVYNDEGAYVGGAGALDPTRQGGGGGPVDEVAEARRLLNEQNDVELAQLGRERDRLAAQADLDDELDDFLGFGGPANAARGGGDQSDGMQTVVLVLFAVFMCVPRRPTGFPLTAQGLRLRARTLPQCGRAEKTGRGARARGSRRRCAGAGPGPGGSCTGAVELGHHCILHIEWRETTSSGPIAPRHASGMRCRAC